MAKHSVKDRSTQSSRGATIFGRVDRILGLAGWLAVVLFAILAVGPGLTPHTTFLGVDNLAKWGAYEGVINPVAPRPVNDSIGDTIDSVAPATIMLTQEARAGHYPQWNPYSLGGSESGALPNLAPFSPLSLPWWILPPHWAPGAVKLLEIAAVGLGFWLLLRRNWGMARVAAPAATLVFISSGFMLAWTNWPQTRVAAMIPLVFWGVDSLATQFRWRYVVFFGLALASMLLGGFPAIVAYTAYLSIAYFVVRIVATRASWREAGQRIFGAGAGATLGVGLSAINMLPFAWFATHYVDFSSRQFGTSRLRIHDLSTSILPFAYGLPQVGQPWTGRNWIEAVSYLGVMAILLALVAVVVRARTPRAVTMFFGAAFLFLLIALYLGGPLLEVLVKLPGIASSFSGRMRSILDFVVAVLVGLGADHVFRFSAKRDEVLGVRDWNALAVRIVLALGIFGVFALSYRAVWNVSNSPLIGRDIVMAGAAVAVFAVAALVALVTGTRAVRIGSTTSAVLRGVSMTAVLALVLTPSVLVARAWWPIGRASDLYPETPTHRFLKEHIGQQRLVSSGFALTPGTTDVYRLRAMTGHKFLDPAMADLLLAVDPSSKQTATYWQFSGVAYPEMIDSPILDRLGVKYIVAGQGNRPFAFAVAPLDESAQPVLTARARPLSTETFTGPADGFLLRFPPNSIPRGKRPLLLVRIVSDSGEELARSQRQVNSLPRNTGIPVDVSHIAAGTKWHAEVSIPEDGTGPDAGATITAFGNIDGTISGVPITYEPASAPVVFDGKTRIYERKTALPRIRWADSAVVVTDPRKQIELVNAPGLGGNEISLDLPEDMHEVPGGSSATVASRDVNNDEIAVTAKSTGPGWIVIADSMRNNGWQAELDGKPARLVPVDHAYVAVWVAGAGEHHLRLHYEAPFFKLGRTITFLSLALVIGAGAVALVRRRRPAEAAGAAGAVNGAGAADGAEAAEVLEAAEAVEADEPAAELSSADQARDEEDAEGSEPAADASEADGPAHDADGADDEGTHAARDDA